MGGERPAHPAGAAGEPCWEKAKWDSARTKGGSVFQGGAKLPMRACAMYRCATNGGPTSRDKASQSGPSGLAGGAAPPRPAACPPRRVSSAAQHDLALRQTHAAGKGSRAMGCKGSKHEGRAQPCKRPPCRGRQARHGGKRGGGQGGREGSGGWEAVGERRRGPSRKNGESQPDSHNTTAPRTAAAGGISKRYGGGAAALRHLKRDERKSNGQGGLLGLWRRVHC